MKRGDIIIISAVLLIILAFLLPPLFNHNEDDVVGKYAEIHVEGKSYKIVELTEESQMIEIKTNRGFNKVEISRYGVEMIEADCPDQLCRGFGHIHTVNDTIVCLPNRVFIEILAAPGEEEHDAIVF